MPRSECGAAPEADGCWRRALEAPTHRSLDVACAHSHRMRDLRAKAEANALPAGDRRPSTGEAARRPAPSGAVRIVDCALFWAVQWRLARASTCRRRLELSLSSQLQEPENLPVRSPSLVQSEPLGVVPVEGSWSCSVTVFPNGTVPSALLYRSGRRPGPPGRLQSLAVASRWVTAGRPPGPPGPRPSCCTLALALPGHAALLGGHGSTSNLANLNLRQLRRRLRPAVPQAEAGSATVAATSAHVTPSNLKAAKRGRRGLHSRPAASKQQGS